MFTELRFHHHSHLGVRWLGEAQSPRKKILVNRYLSVHQVRAKLARCKCGVSWRSDGDVQHVFWNGG